MKKIRVTTEDGSELKINKSDIRVSKCSPRQYPFALVGVSLKDGKIILEKRSDNL
ncbi:hypothetical protein SAMN05660862_2036 [Sphingobacterium psychroaquaticum]|uniref:Uncharacterized protein n=1 Tax=Sphingobacterium psychroaquaticum TaxID=561061 RepID=A0A1X7JQK2_9SPHI|nr:hypothetical protein SAMN05660862_2036 [Sphingobacterium psychroaquaticum]